MIASLSLLEGYPRLPDDEADHIVTATAGCPVEIRAKALAAALNTSKERYYVQLYAVFQVAMNEIALPEIVNVSDHLAHLPETVGTSVLDKFSDLPDSSFKINALLAIRERRSQESIPTLIRHLDDRNEYVEYLAVATLAEVVPGVILTGTPTLPQFEQERSKYLQTWRDWWIHHGHALNPDTD